MNKTEELYSKIKGIRISLSALSLYRELLHENALHSFYNLIDSLYKKNKYELYEYIDLYNEFVLELFKANQHKNLKEYLIFRILYGSSYYSNAAASVKYDDIDSLTKSAACRELKYLQLISELNSNEIKNYILECFTMSDIEADVIKNLPDWCTDKISSESSNNCCINEKQIVEILMQSKDWAKCIEALSEFHYINGSGLFACYKAFIWDYNGDRGYLRGIGHPDHISLSELIGYEAERSLVIENTLQFLDEFPANNMLLYGDRGTGKSSTVKAIVNEYYTKGLRIIEVPKNRLLDFPKIVNLIRSSRLKFIIFVDDLAFEDNEENFTALKAVLEGSIEAKPGNVLIYATSNRKHIIKEKFSERAGLSSDNLDDEIRAADSIQEKLSLSDRFGLTVVFSSPEKQKYLEIVEGIAKRRGLNVNSEYLFKEAMKWELWYNGRSPRTAVQFINWLEGKSGKSLDID